MGIMDPAPGDSHGRRRGVFPGLNAARWSSRCCLRVKKLAVAAAKAVIPEKKQSTDLDKMCNSRARECSPRFAHMETPCQTAARQRQQSAYTIAEVVVAVLVLTTMMIAIYGGFSYGFTVMQTAREGLRAT